MFTNCEIASTFARRPAKCPVRDKAPKGLMRVVTDKYGERWSDNHQG